MLDGLCCVQHPQPRRESAAASGLSGRLSPLLCGLVIEPSDTGGHARAFCERLRLFWVGSVTVHTLPPASGIGPSLSLSKSKRHPASLCHV